MNLDNALLGLCVLGKVLRLVCHLLIFYPSAEIMTDGETVAKELALVFKYH